MDVDGAVKALNATLELDRASTSAMFLDKTHKIGIFCPSGPIGIVNRLIDKPPGSKDEYRYVGAMVGPGRQITSFFGFDIYPSGGCWAYADQMFFRQSGA